MDLTASFLMRALPQAHLYFSGKKYQLIKSSSLESDTSLATWFEIKGKNIQGSIDTRTLDAGKLFLAFRGEKVDGHIFIQQALEKGAVALLIEKNKEDLFLKLDAKLTHDVLCIVVDDTLKALMELARLWRAQFSIPIIGITGSLGKTTTKEMVKTILEVAGINACVNSGNQNSHIGLALNILKLNASHQVGIFEVGISYKGEMAELADMLQPTMALITGVWPAHSGGIGDLDSIAFEKRQLFKNLKMDNVGMIFGDQPLLEQAFYQHPIIKFGTKLKNQIQARNVITEQMPSGEFFTTFSLVLYKKVYKVRLAGNHPALVLNAVAAATIANALQVSPENIVQGFACFQPVKNHFQPKIISGNRGMFISDCCNASPQSMRTALLTFHTMNHYNAKIAVLGDMLELGEKALFWHRQIGRAFSKALSIEAVILVGSLAKNIAQTIPVTIKIEYAASWQEAQKKLEELLAHKKALVLVKGSKAVGLEYMVQELSKS